MFANKGSPPVIYESCAKMHYIISPFWSLSSCCSDSSCCVKMVCFNYKIFLILNFTAWTRILLKLGAVFRKCFMSQKDLKEIQKRLGIKYFHGLETLIGDRAGNFVHPRASVRCNCWSCTGTIMGFLSLCSAQAYINTPYYVLQPPPVSMQDSEPPTT